MDDFAEYAVKTLQAHWLGAYKISWEECFKAKRLDDGTVLKASTPEGLTSLIRSDYLRRPVAR